MTTRHVLSALALLGAALFAFPQARAADAAGEIRHVMKAQFDKPEAPLQVDPVVVEGHDAVAGWTQGERGGRALLVRQHGRWQIAVCAGDALKDAQVLQEAGVAPAAAQALARRLAAAEAALPAAQRAKFATFDGLIRMDASGQHPPAHKH